MYAKQKYSSYSYYNVRIISLESYFLESYTPAGPTTTPAYEYEHRSYIHHTFPPPPPPRRPTASSTRCRTISTIPAT